MPFVAGAIFVVTPHSPEAESWHLLSHTSSFSSAVEIHFPETAPGATIVAVLKIKAPDSSDFPNPLATYVILEIENE
jgi:hypothetical protein